MSAGAPAFGGRPCPGRRLIVARLPPASAARQVELAWADAVPGGAPQLDADALAAVAVAQLHRAAALVEPAVAPLHQRDQRREQIGALLGQPVSLPGALAGLAVVLALEQPLVDELAQPRGGDGLADPDALGELVEPSRAVEGLAQDQERRARARAPRAPWRSCSGRPSTLRVDRAIRSVVRLCRMAE